MATVESIDINDSYSDKHSTVTVWLENGNGWRTVWANPRPNENQVLEAFREDSQCPQLLRTNWDKV